MSKDGKYEFYIPQIYWKVIIFEVECTSRDSSSPWRKLIQDQKHQPKSFLSSCPSRGIQIETQMFADSIAFPAAKWGRGHCPGEHSHLEEPDGGVVGKIMTLQRCPHSDP